MHVPPTEFEAEYYRQQSCLAIAARLKPGALQDTRGDSIRARVQFERGISKKN